MLHWSQVATRWWYVFRYYRGSQLMVRAYKLLRRRWFGAAASDPDTPRICPRPRNTPDYGHLLDASLMSRANRDVVGAAEKIAQGEFRFLNQSRVLGDPVDWRVTTWPEAPRLWHFHLHYHGFLLDLMAAARETSNPRWHELAWKRVEDWIAHNRPRDTGAAADAWHPYCISQRLPAWFLLWTAAPLEGKRGERVLREMHAQARFLRRNLEWDVRGNHLLENLRALVLAGVFFTGPQADQWLQTGEHWLREELAEQILPHGEHFERSPMYQALMLEAVLDVRDATATVASALSAFCAVTALRMADFLEALLHPDGEIPLLGDSCFGEAPPARVLLDRARQQGRGDAE